MSTSQSMDFSVRTSVLKVLLHIVLLVVLFYCLSQSMARIWVVLVLVGCLIWTVYRVRQQPCIRRINHLDKKTWTISDGQHQQQVQLLRIQNWGVCVVMQMLIESSQQKVHLCIICDQVSWTQWSRLQRLARHYHTQA